MNLNPKSSILTIELIKSSSSQLILPILNTRLPILCISKVLTMFNFSLDGGVVIENLQLCCLFDYFVR